MHQHHGQASWEPLHNTATRKVVERKESQHSRHGGPAAASHAMASAAAERSSH